MFKGEPVWWGGSDGRKAEAATQERSAVAPRRGTGMGNGVRILESLVKISHFALGKEAMPNQ